MIITIILVLILVLLPMFPQIFRHRGRIGQPGFVRPAEKAAEPASEPDAPSFEPKAIDVVIVKEMLQKKLPPELINTVLDHAEYWPHTTSVTSFENLPEGKLKVLSGRSERENVFVIRSLPLGFVKSTQFDGEYITKALDPRSLSSEYSVEQFQKWIGNSVPTLEHPCRKIVFTIHSHDQGWGGNRTDTGTYHGSWTWFEPGIERFDAGGAATEQTPLSEQVSSINPATSTEDLESPSDDSSMDQALLTPDYSEVSEPMQLNETVLDTTSLRPIMPLLEPPSSNEDPSTRRFHHDLLPSNMRIQCNMTAKKDTKAYRVQWSWTDNIDPDSPQGDELEKQGRGRATGTGEFVRNLKLGDVVTVWAKARFPMWVNHVEKVQIDVYWAL